MPRKTDPRALWNELSEEQRETLDKWLFDDQLSFAKTLVRAQKQLGFRGQLSSLKRYSKRRQQERLLDKMKEWGRDAAQASKAGAEPDTLRVANMQVLNGFLFEALREDPNAVKELRPVVTAMLQNDYTEAIRELKSRELQIREEALSFAKEKFQFDTMEKALRALPHLRELAEARRDPETKKAERDERLEMLRQMMFGDDDDEEEEEEERLEDSNDESANDQGPMPKE